LVVLLLLLKEECNDIVVFDEPVAAADNAFITISGFPLQLYKVLFNIILYFS
jgi:hypothetical protein